MIAITIHVYLAISLNYIHLLQLKSDKEIFSVTFDRGSEILSFAVSNTNAALYCLIINNEKLVLKSWSIKSKLGTDAEVSSKSSPNAKLLLFKSDKILFCILSKEAIFFDAHSLKELSRCKIPLGLSNWTKLANNRLAAHDSTRDCFVFFDLGDKYQIKIADDTLSSYGCAVFSISENGKYIVCADSVTPFGLPAEDRIKLFAFNAEKDIKKTFGKYRSNIYSLSVSNSGLVYIEYANHKNCPAELSETFGNGKRSSPAIFKTSICKATFLKHVDYMVVFVTSNCSTYLYNTKTNTYNFIYNLRSDTQLLFPRHELSDDENLIAIQPALRKIVVCKLCQ